MKKLKKAVEDVLSAYEERVESVGSFFDAAYSVLGGLKGSFGDVREEREKLHAQVGEILARNEHLRKKDFNNMMRGIRLAQEQREKEVGDLLKGYIDNEKSVAGALRENLKRFRDALAQGEAERVRKFQVLIKAILAEQEARKQGVASMLLEFQDQQRHSAAKLRELLARGNALRIKDLKLLVKEFGSRRETRQALQAYGSAVPKASGHQNGQKTRKEEVAELLERDKTGLKSPPVPVEAGAGTGNK